MKSFYICGMIQIGIAQVRTTGCWSSLFSPSVFQEANFLQLPGGRKWICMEYPFALYSFQGSFPLHKTLSLNLTFNSVKGKTRSHWVLAVGLTLPSALVSVGTELKFLPARKLLLHPAGGGERETLMKLSLSLDSATSQGSVRDVSLSRSPLFSIWSQAVYFVLQQLSNFPVLADISRDFHSTFCSLRR